MSRKREKDLPWTARSLPGKAGSRKKMESPTQFLAYQVLWCVLLHCGLCAAVVDWSARTAALLYCCGGWWVLGGWRLARSPKWRGVVKVNELPPISYYLVLKTREPTNKCSLRTGILPYVLRQCCTAVMGWSVGSG